MNAVVTAFWSDVPSAFWSIGSPVCSPKVGSSELTVTDQAVSVPVLLKTLSSDDELVGAVNRAAVEVVHDERPVGEIQGAVAEAPEDGPWSGRRERRA